MNSIKEYSFQVFHVDSLPNEEWKDVIGFEDAFQISNMGRVKSKPRKKRGSGNKILKQRSEKPNNGYLMITLNRNGICKTYRTHRLVAIHFCKNVNNKPCVNHIDGDKKNNHYINLEWCTASENQQHSYKTGLHKNVSKGESHTPSKLTNSNVIKIVELLKCKISGVEVAKLFNVSPSTIYQIKRGETWKEFSLDSSNRRMYPYGKYQPAYN